MVRNHFLYRPCFDDAINRSDICFGTNFDSDLFRRLPDCLFDVVAKAYIARRGVMPSSLEAQFGRWHIRCTTAVHHL